MALLHPKTETAVANEALSCLKQPAVISLDADNTNVTRVVKKHFAATRDAMLRDYPWNFAKTRVLLEAQTKKPLFGFAYEYALPNDCVCVRQVYGCGKDDWKVEKRAILSDLTPPLKVIYTRFAYEVAIWDPLFRLAFSRTLAAAIGPELTADDNLIKKAAQEASNTLLRAFPSDAAEGVPEDLPAGDWLDARR